MFWTARCAPMERRSSRPAEPAAPRQLKVSAAALQCPTSQQLHPSSIDAVPVDQTPDQPQTPGDMLFLAVLGGAAVLEVHRALHSGNGDVKELREREATLRRQLQVGWRQAAVVLWRPGACAQLVARWVLCWLPSGTAIPPARAIRYRPSACPPAPPTPARPPRCRTSSATCGPRSSSAS